MDDITIKQKISNLENAIYEGVLEVEFQGKKIKYRSLDEMNRILNTLKNSLQNNSCLKRSIPVFEKY